MTDQRIGDNVDATDDVITEFSITNEFAGVVVRKVATGNGERLEIASIHFGTSVRLDALQLEGLSWQGREFFSYALRGSRGPVPAESSDLDGTSMNLRSDEN